MPRKLRTLIGAVLLAMVVTTGTFAYTYNVATTTLAVAAMGGEIATYTPASTQPGWEEILPAEEFDSEFMLPNGAGDLTEIPSQFPSSGAHWQKVNSEDEFTTYVYSGTHSQYRTDLYSLPDHEGEGNITGITVYFRFASENGDAVSGRAAIKTNNEVYYGTTRQNTGDFETYSHVWTANPETLAEWTWSEIDDLQAGVALRADNHSDVYCTFVYVRVDYRIPPKLQGDVPPGDLFDITTHPQYTGDLTVNVYLTNLQALIKAYSYLNMKVFMADSLEAGKTPEYQILSLENGIANFNIEGGAADNYTIQLTGGSYNLVSGNPDEWGTGWAIVPELYCEINQR